MESLRLLDDNVFAGIKNRILQGLARMAPRATTLRVWLHRARGVRIGKRAFIGTDTIIETSNPRLVWIGDDVSISMRAMIIAHFLEVKKVRIEDARLVEFYLKLTPIPPKEGPG